MDTKQKNTEAAVQSNVFQLNGKKAPAVVQEMSQAQVEAKVNQYASGTIIKATDALASPSPRNSGEVAQKLQRHMEMIALTKSLEQLKGLHSRLRFVLSELEEHVIK